MTTLPSHIPPLHSDWEYRAALRVIESLRGELVSVAYDNHNQKELIELQMRIDAYADIHFPLPND